MEEIIMEQQLDKYGLPLLESIPIGNKNYVLVKTRLQYFRKHYENASITTEILHFDKESIMMKATAYIDGKVVATGTAHEEKSKNTINATSFCEVCETSSIGRCLGILGIGITESVATFDEVNSAIRQQEATERNNELLQYKAESLANTLIDAIDNEDEVGISEVESDYRGNPPLAARVKLALSNEDVDYMEERKERLSAERKAKKEEKEAKNQAFAKEHAEKQKKAK